MRRLLTILLSIFTMTVSAQTTQLLGGPGIKVLNRGDFQADSIFYLPRTLVTSRAPSQAGALRYQASDSTLYQWTGTAWRRITTDADTLLLSTRAWRKKGDDSVAALVAAKVNISDTATMLTPYLRKIDTTAMLSPYVRTAGYGLTKGTQTLSVDTGLMATRVRVQKAVDSLGAVKQNVLTNPVTGTGTNNRLSMFTGTSTIGNSSWEMNSGGLAPIDSSQILWFRRSNDNVLGHAIYNTRVAGSGELLMENFSGTGSGIWLGNSRLRFTGGSRSSEDMRLTGGELLIATTTDNGDYKLQVNGNVLITGALLFNTGTNFGVTTNASMSFFTNNTERYRLTGGGLFQASDSSFSFQLRGLSNNVTYQIGNTWDTARLENALSLTNTAGTGSELDLGSNFIQFRIGSTNISRYNNSGELLIGYSTDQGAFILQANGNALINGNIRTAAPTGGTANDWRLGTVATVTPTSPNRTIEVSIGGTIYYIHAKTTND